MVDLVDALHLGRFVGVIGTDLEGETELSGSVKSLVRLDDQLEAEEVVRIRKFCFTSFRKLELVDVFRDSELEENENEI